ncbi:crossover junction endodeoxyribonuclease RuvC [Kitasatospora albolonga]|uniref:Crossover junction endodeoxyribonuclease RuvC n=1 Tax=Kitasatospora albolonga TaxID=68173 RepID=A0ABC8BMX4_9ACTN|nr:crossover junction endodeoxyribonuclease RuvC [Kitasatospora albolonga]
MRVLGIDPGLTRCGVGVVEGVAGRPLTMLGVGVVRTPADAELGDRLVAVEQGIEAWLDEYAPGYVAVERVFAQHNVRTVMGTAQASAVAMLCAARRGIPVALHTPSEVKAAVTGSGRAEKAQVGAMVTRLLRLDAPPRPADAADALALAICHIWRAPAQNRLQQAVAAHRTQGTARVPGTSRNPGASRTTGESTTSRTASGTSRTPGTSGTPVTSRTPGASAASRTAGIPGASATSRTPTTSRTAGTAGTAGPSRTAGTPAPPSTSAAAPRTSGAPDTPRISRTLKGPAA